ncbi:hypothetical protein [Actinomycetia phage DSL-LC01]|nr:hypothetical protein [Actinomycetia phage DSL-LC01]
MSDADKNVYDKKRVQASDEKLKSGSALRALEAIGMTVEEIEMHDSKQSRSDNKQICSCGHPIARHTETHGLVYCKPSRMECSCKRIRPVVVTSNLRRFLRKTEGRGAMHALSRGILECVKRDEEVEWIVDLVCDRCKKAAERLLPTPVTQAGIAVNYQTGYDALLCPSCAEEV